MIEWHEREHEKDDGLALQDQNTLAILPMWFPKILYVREYVGLVDAAIEVS